MYTFCVTYFRYGVFHYFTCEYAKWASTLITVNSMFTPQLFVMASWMKCGDDFHALFSYVTQLLAIVFSIWSILIKNKEAALGDEWKLLANEEVVPMMGPQPVSFA